MSTSRPAPLDVEARAIFANALEEGRVSGLLEDVVPALCDALEHERKVTAIWRALALGQTSFEVARDDLRALGVDIEAEAP